MAADKVPALRNSAHLPAQDSSDFFRSGASQAERRQKQQERRSPDALNFGIYLSRIWKHR
jgi:hypothetical protein